MSKRRILPILSSNGRPSSTTPLGRPRSNLSSSTSINRIHLSSACSNHIFPTKLPLKKLKPEPWQKLFDGEKKQVYSLQGLTVKKNKQNIDAIISEEFFNLTDDNSNSDENSPRSTLPPAIQAHIDHLCEQIDDLTLQLAEERLNHKQTRTKAEENLTSQLQNQSKQFQELLHRKMVEHEKEIEELNEKQAQTLRDQQNQSHNREEQLRNEIEFLKSSFHSYKLNLDEENSHNLELKITESLEQMKKDFQDKEEEMNRKINEAILKERKNLAARQKMEIENLRKQQQKEIETIHKTFADSAFDRARVETLSKELTTTKLDLEESKERAINLAQRLKDIEIRFADANRQLNDYRLRFDEKTKEIENRYAGRLDQLQLQNADLRSMYMKKCAELVEERTLTTAKLNDKVKLTKKQIQRKVLNIRIASVVPLTNDDEPRRLSTCATVARSRSAFANSHPVSSIYDETTDDNSVTDFTIENVRRETKLRRRTSLPITEEEKDVVRYLSSTTVFRDAIKSKYNFENEQKMIKNFSLEDLQNTFKS